MSDATVKKPKRPSNPMASRNLVRPDYHRQKRITYAEAALIAGVSVRTIYNKVSAGMIPRIAKIGPYRIDREHLDEHLKTGVRVGASS